jgi:hypothetical protein
MKAFAKFVGFLAVALPALAAPCGVAPLSDYIAGSPCNIGNALFSDFDTFPGSAGATPIDPAAILVTPLGTGFRFDLNVSAGAGETLEALFGYVVTGGVPQINTASLIGPAFTGDGAVTLVEDKCLDGLFAGGPFGCDGTPMTLTIIYNAFSSQTAEGLVIGPVSSVAVIKDIVVDGGLTGSASLESATNQFIPEPASFALMGGALCVLALMRRGRAR